MLPYSFGELFAKDLIVAGGVNSMALEIQRTANKTLHVRFEMALGF